jgi:hypothetical protein
MRGLCDCGSASSVVGETARPWRIRVVIVSSPDPRLRTSFPPLRRPPSQRPRRRAAENSWSSSSDRPSFSACQFAGHVHVKRSELAAHRHERAYANTVKKANKGGRYQVELELVGKEGARERRSRSRGWHGERRVSALRALRQLQEPLPGEERTGTLVTASRLLGL